MKNDIDFDELDRAVTSLMGGMPNTANTSDDNPQPKTLSINQTLKPDEAPVYEKLDEVAKRIGSETLLTDNEMPKVNNLDAVREIGEQTAGTNAEPAGFSPVQQSGREAPLNQPRTDVQVSSPQRTAVGRFMDVVHPSSDMKSSPVNMQPVSTPPQDAQASTVKEAPVSAVSSQLPSKFGGAVAPGQTGESAAPVGSSLPSDIEVTSPFIPDAKVEKRPLGDPVAPEEKGSDDFSHLDHPEEIVAINSEAIARQEARKSTQEVLDASKFDTTKSVEQEIREIESKHAEAEQSSQAEALRVVESVEKPVAAHPSGQGAIYDVQDYHQPVHSSAKRKSGWGVVVIVVIIILLAAAIGVGVYLLLGLGN